jgi:hypothetical protein
MGRTPPLENPLETQAVELTPAEGAFYVRIKRRPTEI